MKQIDLAEPHQAGGEWRVDVEGIVIPSAFEELAGELRAAGFEAHQRGRIEERGGPAAAWELLLWVRDYLGPPAALGLATMTARWVRRRRAKHRHAPGSVHVRVLYAPDGRELAKVLFDDKEPKSD